jgi:hypothetical protein
MSKHDTRLKAVQQFVDECLWGDYRLDPEDVIENLGSKKPGFRNSYL